MTGDPRGSIPPVFLAFVTVSSAMVGIAAFSGPATAANNPQFGTFTNSTVDEQTTVTHDVDYDGITDDGDNRNDTYTLTVPDDANITSVNLRGRVYGSATTDYTATTSDLDGDGAPESYTLHLEDIDDNATDITMDVNVTVAWPAVDGDTTYTVTGNFTDDAGSAVATETITVRETGAANDDKRAANPDGTGDYDTTDGTGYVFSGAVVFQGEDFETDDPLRDGLKSSLTGVGGDAAGQVLDPPIPQHQTPGRYSNGGTVGASSITVDAPQAVTVKSPRINTLEIRNGNGADISGGSVGENNARNLTVHAESNYEVAEDLELTVENSYGHDVTGDVLRDGTPSAVQAEDDNPADADGGAAVWRVDLSHRRSGTFTVEVAGSDDLDFDSAVQTATVEVTDDRDRSALPSETAEDAASDDAVVSANAQNTDGRISITAVYQDGDKAGGLNPVAVGETMVVEGTTNAEPEDTTITVELANDDTPATRVTTEPRDQNGRWSVALDTTEASTGTYTLEVDDGNSVVTEEVELVERTTPTETATPTATATRTDTPRPAQGAAPGFGAVIAVIALLATALLTARREQ